MTKRSEGRRTKRTGATRGDPFEHFKRACMKTFAFLVSDFGFRLVSANTHIPECLVEYTNESLGVGVDVTYEWESEVWVVVSRLDPASKEPIYSNGIGLDFLIAVRCPKIVVDNRVSGVRWTNKRVSGLLSVYAAALRECGRDLLEGDFSNLADVRKYQRLFAARTARALYSGKSMADIHKIARRYVARARRD